MFLTESSVSLSSYGDIDTTITENPADGYRLLFEAEESWGKIAMAMAKVEHLALINENQKLLEEGKEGFFAKLKQWYEVAKEKVLQFIDKVKNAWNVLQIKFRTKFLTNYNGVLSKAKESDKKVSVNEKVFQGIASLIPKIGSLVSSREPDKGKVDEIIKEINALKNAKPKEFVMKTNVATVKNALDFIKDGRGKAIDLLSTFRKAFETLGKSMVNFAGDESENKAKELKEIFSNLNRALNEFVIIINKATLEAIKSLPISVGTGSESDKNTDKIMKESTNVLDMYMN